MRRRAFHVLAVVMLLVTLLASCSNGGSSTGITSSGGGGGAVNIPTVACGENGPSLQVSSDAAPNALNIYLKIDKLEAMAGEPYVVIEYPAELHSFGLHGNFTRTIASTSDEGKKIVQQTGRPATSKYLLLIGVPQKSDSSGFDYEVRFEALEAVPHLINQITAWEMVFGKDCVSIQHQAGTRN